MAGAFQHFNKGKHSRRRGQRDCLSHLRFVFGRFDLRQLMLFAEELLSKKRYLEAARVFIDYAGDIRQAVIALVQGNELSEARRIVSIAKSLA